MTNRTASDQIIRTGQELLEKGLVARTWGNISCKIADDESNYEGGSFMITASGRDYQNMSTDETVEIGIKNFKYESDYDPSMEYKIHGQVYRLKPEAGFVIHSHQSSASVVSAMGLDRVEFDKEYDGVGSFVLCSAYGMAGSLRLCGNVAKTINESAGNAIIMKNHGALIFGKDKDEAMKTALNLEEACGNYLRHMGIEPWNQDEWCSDGWINNSVIEKYMAVRDSLPAYIDDFAQMIGYELPILDECSDEVISAAELEEKPLIVRGRGVLCAGEDKEAMALVIDKNCRAALASLGVKPLDPLRSIYMNRFYRKKYSKLNKK